jgi:hypothetical protein
MINKKTVGQNIYIIREIGQHNDFKTSAKLGTSMHEKVFPTTQV